MKPIILKAVTGSIFLLVVASALYFFTRTIFVYQERSKAAVGDGGITYTDIEKYLYFNFSKDPATENNKLSFNNPFHRENTYTATFNAAGANWQNAASSCGGAVSFLGNGRTIDGDDNTIPLGVANNFAIMAWIKPKPINVSGSGTYKRASYIIGVSDNFSLVLDKNTYSADPNAKFSRLAGEYVPKNAQGQGETFILIEDSAGRGDLVADTWYHVAFVYNQADRTARLYLNGEQIASQANLEPPAEWLGAARTTFGKDASNVNNYEGVIDEAIVISTSSQPILDGTVDTAMNNCNPISNQPHIKPIPFAPDALQPPTNTPTSSPRPTVAQGEQCNVTDQCDRGLVCKSGATAQDPKTCQPGIPPGEVCNDGNPNMQCGRDYYCANPNENGNGRCELRVCDGTTTVGCVTATPSPTATRTPTPTPYTGEAAPVCTNHSECGTRPYYVLIERKDQENKPIYDLRYFAANNEAPSDAIYSIVSNGVVVEPPVTIASGEFRETASPFSRYATIPFQYLFRVKVQDTTSGKNMGIYVGSANMTAPPWTIKTDVQGDVTYKVFLRPGLAEIATPTPTVTRTPTPTPTGFNLYIDPVGTDPELDAVELRLETGVRQGPRRGERFSMRIVASPKNTNLRSEFIFLKEIKVPVQYALPVNPNSIILESIRTTNNAQCADYRLDDPQEDEIGTVSAFYLRAVYKNSSPKQLAAGTCIAEFTFDVKESAQFNDSATVKLLTESESEGIGEVDTVPAMMGAHALAYHLVRNAPTTTPAVTPATIHPKVNLSYDDANRSKTVTVDISRYVEANAPDLIIQTADLIRTSPITPTACGPVNIRVVVKNQGQSAADPFTISVNGQKKASTKSEPEVSNGGLGVGAVKTYYFDKIKFNADGPNTIHVDSEDDVIELREDNNYVDKKFVFADIPGNSNTQCPNPTNTPTNTPTPTSLTPTPTYIPDPNKINLVMLVKLQGVNQGTFSSQYSRLKFGVAIGGGKLESNTEYVYNDFVHKGEGRYEGVVSFDPTKVAVGGGYRIIVKGPKHLAKRFCVAAPTGGYAYFCPANTANITLKKGINSFDFTNVQLIAGDIPNGEQDGVVDSSDLAFIRDNLGIKLPEIIKIGDLNLDGIIDTQDYSMVINNLVNNEDEN